MYKQLVVRPVSIRDTCRQCFAKCVLAVVGPEAKEACRIEQLCVSLKTGIEGGINVILLIW